MLHITNGESVICSFEQVKLPGEYLSWLDSLHDGPVPRCESLEALSEVRARYVASCGWSSYEDALERLTRRDRTLAAARDHDEVVLWFEHDLFDELQLLQILEWLHTHPPLPATLSMIHIEGYLGQLPGQLLAMMLPSRKPVSVEQFELAQRAWQAFVSPEPSGIVQIASEAHTALPFLQKNFIRFLEEYPSTRNGLTRSEEQILKAVAAGHREPHAIFYAFCEMEEAVFMGDSPVWQRMAYLSAEPAAIRDQEGYEITALGQHLLNGEADWIRTRGGIDRWLGGVHLHGADAQWRWDAAAKTLKGDRFL